MTPDQRAAIQAASDALHTAESYECPVCGGDCASANPPARGCPMRDYRDARDRLDELLAKENPDVETPGL